MSEHRIRPRSSAVLGVRAFRHRLDQAVRRRVEEAVLPIRARVENHGRRIRRLERRLDERLPGAVRDATVALSRVERMEPQVSSMETRLEEMRQRLESRLEPGTPEEQLEAQRLLDEVRREHERVRSRLTAISWYEERLRRLEERLESTP